MSQGRRPKFKDISRTVETLFTITNEVLTKLRIIEKRLERLEEEMFDEDGPHIEEEKPAGSNATEPSSVEGESRGSLGTDDSTKEKGSDDRKGLA